MPITHTEFAQGTVEWHKVRLGKVTASEMGEILTPDFAIRKGETPRSYLYLKLAEKLSGEVVSGFQGSWETEHGQMLEDEARKWFAFESGMKLHNVAFVETDDGRAGCSPDALIGEDGGLELKCPQAKNHMRYLVEGILPKDYATQVHGSMFVTGRKWWQFVSYHRKLPPFVIQVERDEEIIAKIAAGVAAFTAEFDRIFSQWEAEQADKRE